MTGEEGITRTTLDMAPGDRFQSVRRELGVESFGINLIRLEPRQRGRVHRHERQEEIYLVVEGELTLLTGDEEHVLGLHDAVRVPPGTRRQLVNRGPAPLRLLALGGAGEHVGRDGIAYGSWDEPDSAGRPPQEVPLPADLPAGG
jgi:uncharacterized cupin superfamily protein